MKRTGFFAFAAMAAAIVTLTGCGTANVPGITGDNKNVVLASNSPATLDPSVGAALVTPEVRKGWWNESGGKPSPYFGKLRVREVDPAKSTAYIEYVCDQTGGGTTGWSGRVKLAPDGSFKFRPEWGRNFTFRLQEDGSLSGNASIPEGMYEVTMK